MVAAKTSVLFELIDAVGNDNASGEYYLTDIVEIARKKGLTATAVACEEAETMGINSRAELASAEAAFQARSPGPGTGRWRHPARAGDGPFRL